MHGAVLSDIKRSIGRVRHIKRSRGSIRSVSDEKKPASASHQKRSDYIMIY
jgi:hypothetical protein